MKTNITPEMLRGIADSLAGDVRGGPRSEFICCAADYLLGDIRGRGVTKLLCECGIPSLLGGLGLVDKSPGWETGAYTRTAMPIRFMFLEFMALMIEGETP